MAETTDKDITAAYSKISYQSLFDTMSFFGSLGGLFIIVLSPLPKPRAKAGNISVTIFKNKI
jgi:hypothetical protein